MRFFRSCWILRIRDKYMPRENYRHSSETIEKIRLANTGKYHSEETKEKLRKINLGRRLSEETKKRMSISRMGVLHPMFGKHLSFATKEKIRIANLGKKYSDETKLKHRLSQVGRKYSESTREKHRQFRIHQIIPKETSIEKILQSELIKNGILFEKHKSIVGRPDVFINPNICIFVDGCYWHSCRQCYDYNKFDSRQWQQISHDASVTKHLLDSGYKVLRFWEHDIKNNMFCIINKVKEVLE